MPIIDYLPQPKPVDYEIEEAVYNQSLQQICFECGIPLRVFVSPKSKEEDTTNGKHF